MKIKKTTEKLLRFSKSESLLYAALGQELRRPSEIVRISGLPNATAYLAFSTLAKRGLAEKKNVRGKTFWTRSPLPSLEQLLRESIGELYGIESGSVLEIPHSEDTSVTVHRGTEALRNVIHQALTLNTHDRFYIFQGANLDDGWMEVIGFKNVLRINKELKDKRIIGESFIPENYFSTLIPVWGEKWARSYIDRTNIIHLLPQELFASHAEILILKDRAIIFYVKGRIAIEIRNKEILALFKGLFEYFKASARMTPPQEYLKKNLKGISTS